MHLAPMCCILQYLVGCNLLVVTYLLVVELSGLGVLSEQLDSDALEALIRV